jgi:hypothetical protein
MNFNNTIILEFGKSGRKGKFVIDKDMIKSIFTNIERDHAAGCDKEITFVRVNVEDAEVLGITNTYQYRNDKYVDVPVANDIKVVLGLVKGDKGMMILHGE